MFERTTETDRYAQAVVLACTLHATQTRDDGKTPYSIHPVRVAEHLRRIAGEQDESVILGALLHDTLEDCANVTYDTLAQQFGEATANYVAEVTNDNRLPKARRRAAMIEHLPQLSPQAKRIKLSDRYDNVLDLLAGGGTPEKRGRYCAETERILTACAGSCPPLERALQEALEKLRKAV